MAVPLFFRRFRTGLTPETIAITLATGLFFFLLLCPLIGLLFDLIPGIHDRICRYRMPPCSSHHEGWAFSQQVSDLLQQLPVPE